jgi:hypothetical protein
MFPFLKADKIRNMGKKLNNGQKFVAGFGLMDKEGI